MVDRRICTFCGNEIEPGTGKLFVKMDGTVFNFCSGKCQKNMLELKRVPRRTRWSNKYEKHVMAELKKKQETKKEEVKPVPKKAAKKPAPKKASSQEAKKEAAAPKPEPKAEAAKKPAPKKPVPKKPVPKAKTQDKKGE
ncbi:MAG: 50S ribosomal protein L24e [Candidatus Thermoplasmatota archaeon]|nr:50S ribosomal protein L24e [Candidatus Thermoplasmatota archaeon]